MCNQVNASQPLYIITARSKVGRSLRNLAKDIFATCRDFSWKYVSGYHTNI